jgi:hypothetical protein
VFFLALAVIILIPQSAQIQDVTPEATPERAVGLLAASEGAYDGYTVYTPLLGHTVYLLDKNGQVAKSLTFDATLTSEPYILDNGGLLFTTFVTTNAMNDPFAFGGAGGQVEEHAPDGTLVWSFQFADEGKHQHHDIRMMPNGHILMLGWEQRPNDVAVAAGAKADILPESGQILFEQIVEVDPASSKIVWEWHVLDHLIQDYDSALPNYGAVKQHPERIDINYPQSPSNGDWYHNNAIDYNPQLDQILISSRSLSEIWVIDHSTTTAQAAGHTGGKSGKGGDLLYRWGNPSTYQAGGTQKLFYQHDAHWIRPGLPGAGNILIFNNGVLDGQPDYSTVVEIAPPLNSAGLYDLNGDAYGPDEPVWEYKAAPAEGFFSPFIGSAQRLPGGNTFIDEGNAGNFFEVTPDGRIVWKYTNGFTGDVQPTGPFQPYSVFRARHYAANDPGVTKFLGS